MRHLNKLSVSSKPKYPSYKLAAVIVHKFKLRKPHYVDFVKSGSNWIQHDNEMIQKNSIKSVLETCGISDGEEDQPLATMLIYTSLENSCEVLIPAHLTERYYKLFLHRKQERSTIICYQLTCYQPHLLSPHLLSEHLRSHSFAIKPHLLSSLNCYRHICYQASLAIRPFCNQSSIAINNFAINHHLLSNFRLALDPYFNQFFPLKIRKKFLKILEFFILWQTLRGHGTGSFCTNLLKDSNNYLYFHQKDLGKQYTGHLYRCQKYKNGCKAVAVLLKESNEQVLIAMQLI